MMMMSVLVLNEVVLGHLVTLEIAEVHVWYEFHRLIFNCHHPLIEGAPVIEPLVLFVHDAEDSHDTVRLKLSNTLH